MKRPTVLVVGGGFAGLYAARRRREPRLSNSPDVLRAAIGLVSAADGLQQLETLRDLEAPLAATLRVNSTPWWRRCGFE